MNIRYKIISINLHLKVKEFFFKLYIQQINKL
jgi:hypothetical protein